MTGFSNSPTRDLRNGVVCFDGWEGLTESEKRAAEAFEEGIENNLRDDPPTLEVDVIEPDDLLLTFTVNALGRDYDGPEWQYSLKHALTGFQCDKQDATGILRALEALVEHVKTQIDLIPEHGLNPFSVHQAPVLIGLDGETIPQSPMKQWMDKLAPQIMAEMVTKLKSPEIQTALDQAKSPEQYCDVLIEHSIRLGFLTPEP